MGSQHKFIFNVQTQLLADLPIRVINESVDHSIQQQFRQEAWVPKLIEDAKQTTIGFSKHGSEQASFFRFEVEQSLPDTQLCPPGSLFVNQSLQIEWTSTAQRVPLLATLDCKHQNELIAQFEETFVNADKMTFMC